MKGRLLHLPVFLLLVFGSSYCASYSSLPCSNNPCSKPYNIKSTIPPVPEYLKDKSNTPLCRVNGTETVNGHVLICEREKLKPECICTFHQIYNRSNHNYTACPGNGKMDSATHMTCSECEMYSVNKTGPCLNGGTIKKCEDKQIAADITCSCPPYYFGNFCENVTRYICCLEASNKGLETCDGKPTGKCKDGDFTCHPSSDGDTWRTLQRCDSLGSTQHLTNTGTVCENRLTIFVLLYMVAKYFKTIGS
uniref:Uncharacterized protein LOC111127271 n=1 Tax=Crassostrea virginica TaxID=6565 RepID=A0A8B8DIX1_CRAVI|nr:uncharacterized protein LOC111127271 [Crassostrea virginica]